MESFPQITIVGVGAMGEALLAGLLSAGCPPERITGIEPHSTRRQELTSRFSNRFLAQVDTTVAETDLIMVVVKPGEVQAVIEQLTPHIGPNHLVVSLAAGIRTSTYETAWPETPVIRAMPNTPALIAQGATAIAPGTKAKAAQVEQARVVCQAVGTVVVLSEEEMDAVTAVSGSGPAYLFLLAESMISAAVGVGLEPDVATELVTQTLVGAANLMHTSDREPTELRQQVTSPHGTTAAALEVFAEGGFDTLVSQAITKARDRSIELAADSSTN